MNPASNQPARLYGTAKTNKFETLEDITIVNLKFNVNVQCGKSYIGLFKIFM